MSQPDLNNIFISKIYSKLIECAVSGETINTEQLVDVAGLPKTSPRTVQKAMNEFLSTITKFEQNRNRPMLTALIVQKSNKPTKAWLRSYFLTKVTSDEVVAEERAKALLSASASEDCKQLLLQEQKLVVEYWSIPQQ